MSTTDLGASVTPPVANHPHLTQDEFSSLFDRLRRWAPDVGAGTPPPDEHGALAHVGTEAALRALATPRSGRVISLALPINRTSGPDNQRPALHHMVDLGDVEAPEPTGHKDFIGLDYHGKAVSHLDALCHIAYRGTLYGGVAAADAMSSLGSSWAAVTNMAHGIVTRGVLLDIAAARGVDWIEPGTAVHAEDVLAAEEHFGFHIGPGDAVLLRSGHVRRKAALGAWNPDNASAGFHVDAMELLADRDIGVLGGDGDSDVRPSPVSGVHSPIHALALTALGIPLLDNLDLEDLSTACASAGRHEFMLVVAPLVVPGGTGSPVNPLAIL